MTYTSSLGALGTLATVSADRVTRIKQGLQDLHMLPAGIQASMPDTAYALKQWAAAQHLPTSYVVWNGTTLQIDNVLADQFAAAVTEARRNPGLVTSRASTAPTPQYVQSASKTDPTEPFVPSTVIPSTPAPGPLDFLKSIPAWGWAVGAVGVAAIGYVVLRKKSPATMTANRRRRRKRSMRRNRTSLSSETTAPFRRTTRRSRSRSSRPKRKLGKLRLLVRGRGKKMYVYPRRKRAEVLRGRVTIKPNRRRIRKNGTIDIHYGLGAYGKAYVDDWIVKPFDLPYYHRSYGMKSLDHAKRFAEGLVRTLKKEGYDARTLRFDQSMAA